MAVDDSVVNRLNGQTLGGVALVTGTNLFRGPPRLNLGGTTPVPCVFVLANGGSAPQPYLGVGKDVRLSGVLVVVRAAPDKFAAGQSLARGVWTRLQRAPLDITGAVDCQCQNSEPSYFGEDDDGLHEWNIQLQVTFTQ